MPITYARSEGIYPIEGFSFDEELEITDTSTPAKLPLASIDTIRVIVIAKRVTGAGSTAVLEVTLGGQGARFESNDTRIDTAEPSVMIFHLRGANSTDNNVQYTITQGNNEHDFTDVKVYYESVKM